MPNIYGLLTIGQTAMLAQQKAIDITGNNIANVNTEGYSRQRLNLVQNSPVRVNDLTMSTGVSAEQEIQRFYDAFVTLQINSEKESYGRWEAQKSALEKVELMFDETSEYGISQAMTEFWNEWQQLSKNPSGTVERTSLISSAIYLTKIFNETSDSLTAYRSDIDTSVNNVVEEINSIADKIAELNLQITEVEVTGHNANEYRDEREMRLKELSSLIDIEYFEDEMGQVSVVVGGSKTLVEKSTTWDLVTIDNGGVQDVYWQSSDGTNVNITSDIDDGELKGWIETRDTLLPGYLSELDSLAAAIVSGVNAIHSAGTTLDGTTTTGVNFFDPTGTTAGSIAVNSAVLANTDLIAAAYATEGIPGGNQAAIDIAELQNTTQATLGNATFDDFYSALVGTIGNDLNTASFNYDHQITMLNQLENQRQEISGVSLDEEMVNLIKFQHAYNAAAKMITTADELIQTLLGLVQ
jgi:flagellar hook-associated protein 1 FlgK